MTAAFLAGRLAGQGVRLVVSGDGRLVVEGPFSDDELQEIRAMKAELVEYLTSSESSESNRTKPDTWGTMRELAPMLGKTVQIGGVWGHGILWGLSPWGAAVDVGQGILTFEFAEVRPE